MESWPTRTGIYSGGRRSFHLSPGHNSLVFEQKFKNTNKPLLWSHDAQWMMLLSLIVACAERGRPTFHVWATISAFVLRGVDVVRFREV